ncbi:hypothetical protein HK100_007433, partial [Physocladia obscura]
MSEKDFGSFDWSKEGWSAPKFSIKAVSLQAVWYRLVLPDGNILDPDLIQVPTDSLVVHVKKAVKVENPNALKAVDSLALKPYKNQASFDAKVALEVDDSVAGLGASDIDLIVIVVPIQTNPSPSRESSSLLLFANPNSNEPTTKKQRTVVPKWKDELPFVYSLEKGTLFFVNRKDAVEQLQKIHRSKFERAQIAEGKEWIIPIADNVLGLGKSAFGRHYIRRSRETLPEAANRNPFQQALCDCHTVAITFRKGALLEDTFDAVILKYLTTALKPMFTTEPAILTEHPKTSYAFLVDLTESVGPSSLYSMKL